MWGNFVRTIYSCELKDQVLKPREGKKPSVNSRISASEVIRKGLVAPQSKSHRLRWSLFLPGICFKVYFEDSPPKPVFSVWSRMYFAFLILAIPFILNFRPSLATTHILFPPFHRITRVASQSNSSCILVLALSHLFSFSDALMLSIGLQADCYYQLAGFG